MEYQQLPKSFFKKNPIDELSPANIAYFTITAGFDDRLNHAVFDLIKDDIEPQRLDKIHQEQEKISRLESGEDVVRFMRSNYDILNHRLLCERVLTMQQIAIPPILHRFRTSMQECFIESATYILSHTDQPYIDQLKALYPEIRNPYAQSTACLVLGIQKQQDTLPMLLAEYQRLHKEFPEENLYEWPLLAIYILCDKA